MRNRYVLKSDEWEDHDNPVYVKHVDWEKDCLFGYDITEDITKAQRFAKKMAYRMSDEIYDSYCDDFEVINTTETNDGSK